jgi:glycosyltransferase involved in cell wall biosynthesis
LADADVLVITSENEGLTLTSFEATAAGIPVISTDVGSQASVVADDLLCPRHTYPFVRSAAAHVRTMISSPEQRKRWIEDQAAKTEAFAKLPRAGAWARELYQGWLS